MSNTTIRYIDVRANEGVNIYIKDKIQWIEETLHISGDTLSGEERMYYIGALKELYFIKGLR